jgi:hypothetical protein
LAEETFCSVALTSATPACVLSVPLPRVAPLSSKATVPVGVPAPGATTPIVAVTVTDCPTTAALAEELSVIVVAALFSFWL